MFSFLALADGNRQPVQPAYSLSLKAAAVVVVVVVVVGVHEHSCRPHCRIIVSWKPVTFIRTPLVFAYSLLSSSI
jgi:hypothetical protein